MEQALTLAALAALGVQITSIVAFLRAGELDRALKAIVPWIGLFAALLLGAQADATADLIVPGLDVPLGRLDVASMLLVAMTAGSTGSQTLVRFSKAIDAHSTVQEPRLGGGPPV